MGKKKHRNADASGPGAAPPPSGAGVAEAARPKRHGGRKAAERSAKRARPEGRGTDGRGAVDEAVQAVLHAPVRPEPGPQGQAAMQPMPEASPAPTPPVPPRPAETAGHDSYPMPDFNELARNIGAVVDQGARVAAAYLGARDGGAAAASPGEGVSSVVKTLGRVAEHWWSDPGRLLQAQAALSAPMLDLWRDSFERMAGTGTPRDEKADKRFGDPEWRSNPFFDLVRRAYLIGSDWAIDLVDKAESVDEPTRDRARFYMRQIASALSPANFPATNPEVLKETLRQNGGNLVKGMAMLAQDIAAGHGDLKVRQTDASGFRLGVNTATTPGKVVFRNELMELLQYAPSTGTVLKRPLLIVPPWINKYYILDLNPDKSFIRWAVAQGLTVFVVSWVNPDARHAGKDWDAYMREGILEALIQVGAATGVTEVAVVGYCVGGTLLAASLAAMAGTGDRRVTSATFLTTQVDFQHAGDLKAFADEDGIRAAEAEMSRQGYLAGTKMAQAFNMLRPDDLIWSYVVNNYLKGREPAPFDLLAWNADATRMPAANHSFYLRNCYLENRLARGTMELGGQTLDLGRVTVPVYNLATREDHIAPARSVFEGSRLFGGPVRYVLAGSGHIAGVVSPPARAKYGFRTGPAATGAFADWLDASVEQRGSWWTDWFAWLEAQASERGPARVPSGDLGDAPGTYVRVRS